MTEARVRTYQGDLVTSDTRIDWQGVTEVRLPNAFGDGRNFAAEHESRADGYIVLYELIGLRERERIEDVSPGEVINRYRPHSDNRLRITHQDIPKVIGNSR